MRAGACRRWAEARPAGWTSPPSRARPPLAAGGPIWRSLRQYLDAERYAAEAPSGRHLRDNS
eukprot:15452926-Alexandrium_andersonii.AAC.1